MTDKEKLIELIGKFCGSLTISDIQPPYGFENLADYLISNGVTFAERCNGNCFACACLCDKRVGTYCG